MSRTEFTPEFMQLSRLSSRSDTSQSPNTSISTAESYQKRTKHIKIQAPSLRKVRTSEEKFWDKILTSTLVRKPDPEAKAELTFSDHFPTCRCYEPSSVIMRQRQHSLDVPLETTRDCTELEYIRRTIREEHAPFKAREDAEALAREVADPESHSNPERTGSVDTEAETDDEDFTYAKMLRNINNVGEAKRKENSLHKAKARNL